MFELAELKGNVKCGAMGQQPGSYSGVVDLAAAGISGHFPFEIHEVDGDPVYTIKKGDQDFVVLEKSSAEGVLAEDRERGMLLRILVALILKGVEAPEGLAQGLAEDLVPEEPTETTSEEFGHMLTALLSFEQSDISIDLAALSANFGEFDRGRFAELIGCSTGGEQQAGAEKAPRTNEEA